MTKELSYCDVRTAQCEDEIVKCEKKNKGTIKCDKRIVICDVETAQCEDETVKYDVLATWGCLVWVFKQQFSLFKQHNTYFHNTFSPKCISKKN